MAKNSIRDYSATNSSNTDIQSIDISEGCSPAGINNAIREVMADLKDVSTGAVALESPAFDSVTGNLNVNGTVTADGLTVDASSVDMVTLNHSIPANTTTIGQDSSGDFRIRNGGTDRLKSLANGDFELYEDTGTTAKFFWDASAERLLVGNLYLGEIASNYDKIQSTSSAGLRLQSSGGSVYLDSGGNVGIGTSGPASLFGSGTTVEINGSAGAALRLARPSYANGDLYADENGLTIRTQNNYQMRFLTNNTLAATIDTSQNLLVGKTSIINADAGIELNSTGQLVATFTNGTHILARNAAIGSILQFQKDGAPIGTIGNAGSRIYLADNPGNMGISFFNSRLVPTNVNGSVIDNVYDCGHPSYRWDDIYATNGTIQTSDQNEKQQIAALTDAEITAAKAISALFKTFKWNDAVSEKGDAARTHAGVIAQDVQAAMTAAGLDAGDYAFFISSTWWETQTEVPAVEAVEAVYEDVVIPAVLDEDGNEVEAERTEQRTVTEAVEAVAAYTRTDTYDTAEEAPEGATERNRKGIRYPELLAFVGAATEQRLANIETRLAALEAN